MNLIIYIAATASSYIIIYRQWLLKSRRLHNRLCGIVARLSNRIGRDSGSTSGCSVVQPGVRLRNRHPVAQPARLRIRAEHIAISFVYKLPMVINIYHSKPEVNLRSLSSRMQSNSPESTHVS